MLKKSDIKTLCNDNTFPDAVALCSEENICNVQIEACEGNVTKVHGLVQGNFNYFHQVDLTINRSINRALSSVITSYSCNCYAQTKLKTPCVHCAALALSLVDEEDEPDDQIIADPTLFQRMIPAVQPVLSPADPADVALEKQPSADPTQVAAADHTPAEPELQAPAEPQGMEILFGHQLDAADDNGDPVPLYWTPNDTSAVFHTNTGIIGTMGTGKTQFTKSLITQLYRQRSRNFDGSPLGILIFDYKGDYNESKPDFIQATKAKVLKLNNLPFNPLALVRPKVPKPLLPVHTANAFKDTLSRVFRLGPKQQTTLFSCIMEAYEKAGIHRSDASTWSRTPPTFDMVNEIYEQKEESARNDSLAVAMQKLQMFELFQSNPYATKSLFSLLNGVVVIDLSGYDADIQSLVVGITLDQFYAQMHALGSSAAANGLRQLTKLILVDEADNFMSEDFPALKKIMKEGREFGVGTVLSTQSLNHFTTGEDNYSRYILTWVVHKVDDLKKNDVEYIFKVKAGSPEAQELYDATRSSKIFQSTVKIGNAPACRIRDKAFFEL